jgi:hypothetical protein
MYRSAVANEQLYEHISIVFLFISILQNGVAMSKVGFLSLLHCTKEHFNLALLRSTKSNEINVLQFFGN